MKTYHENYQQYLTLTSKTGKIELDKLKLKVSGVRKRLKNLTEKYEGLISQLTDTGKKHKKDIEFVKVEYSYRRKINSLLKKHNYLDVDWDSVDGYTIYVSCNYFEDYDDKGDPFVDQHYCNSYKEAYEMCLKYIKYHETKWKTSKKLKKGLSALLFYLQLNFNDDNLEKTGDKMNLKKEINELSMSIAYLLDEPSEVTQEDLYNLQSMVTKLENEVDPQKDFLKYYLEKV